MKTIRFLIVVAIALLGCQAISENYAITIWTGQTNGIPDGWPKTKRPLKEGEKPAVGETVVTEEALKQIIAERASVMAARDASETKAKEDKVKSDEKTLRDGKRDLRAAFKNWDALTASEQRAITPTIIKVLLIMLKDDDE